MLRGSRASCQPCTCHAGWRLDCSWSAPRFDARGRVAASRPGDAGGGVAIGGRHLGLRPPGEGICSHRNAAAQGGGRVGCREMPVQGPHGWTECSRARRAGVRACGNRLGPGRDQGAGGDAGDACEGERVPAGNGGSREGSGVLASIARAQCAVSDVPGSPRSLAEVLGAARDRNDEVVRVLALVDLCGVGFAIEEVVAAECMLVEALSVAGAIDYECDRVFALAHIAHNQPRLGVPSGAAQSLSLVLESAIAIPDGSRRAPAVAEIAEMQLDACC